MIRKSTGDSGLDSGHFARFVMWMAAIAPTEMVEQIHVLRGTHKIPDPSTSRLPSSGDRTAIARGLRGQPRASHGHHARRQFRLLTVALVYFGLTLLWVGCDGAPDSQPSVEVTEPSQPPDAKAMLLSAISAGDWETAEQHANQALIANPDDPELITEVAKVNAMRGRKRDAAKMLIEAAKLADYQPAGRVEFAVQALIEVGEIYLVIELLEQSLAQNPNQDKQRRMLVGFLGEIQRTEKIAPHLKQLIQDRAFDLNLLLATCETSSRRLSQKTSSRLLERNPDDHRPRLAEAFLHLYRHDAARCLEVLEDILAKHPKFAPAHAMYGQALVLAQRWDDLPKWLRDAPPESAEYVNYWLTMGDAAIEYGRPWEALNAYWEATRRDPNSSAAWDRLRTAMLTLRQSEANESFDVGAKQVEIVTKHSNTLLEFRERFNEFAGSNRQSQSAALRVARQLFNLGRLWEAEAWSALATTLPEEPSSELAAFRNQTLQRLRTQRDWVATDIPSRKLDFSHFPAPTMDVGRSASKRSNIRPAKGTHDHLRFSERSAEWGLKGVAANNNPADGTRVTLAQTTGVGGGAIDFDLDGLPDLLIMAAGGNILEQDSGANILLHHRGNRFEPVGAMTGLTDRGYGQGVVVGDYNEDGFPDLFFANLGGNRLYRNNGDGSFTDCTSSIDDKRQQKWSTSGSFVDVDEDGLADLVVANYCLTVPGLDKECTSDVGTPTPCHPLKFPADFDQFLVATETGGYKDVTDQWVRVVTPGRALGIVAGHLDGSGLGIYVANDMTRNLYFSKSRGDDEFLVDGAAARGVAVDALARAQASMGIATGDFDLDGDLDFYVTGFGREYNIYYEQISPGTWKDETGKVGLIEPTLPMIGFGAEAIDMDNDGIDELLVTNGHIGEFSGPDVPPYELPLQLFRRGDSGLFEVVNDDAWGPYFNTGHVGRALWTCDVNLDGHYDALITHTHEQIRLLVNETEDRHHRVGFRLVATASSRDAVGAILRFRCNGVQRTLWRLSGDGYLCSNEKTLLAGLGGADEITDLSVTWQDGSIEKIGSLPADRIYQITQGMSEAFELHQYPEP